MRQRTKIVKSKDSESVVGEESDSPKEIDHSDASKRDERRRTDRAELRARRAKRKAKRAGKDDGLSGSKALTPSAEPADRNATRDATQQQSGRRRRKARANTPSDVAPSGKQRRQRPETIVESTDHTAPDKTLERDLPVHSRPHSKGAKRAGQRAKRRQPETAHPQTAHPPAEVKASVKEDPEAGRPAVGPPEPDGDQEDGLSAEDELEELDRAAGRGRNVRILSSPAPTSIIAGDQRQATQLFGALRNAFEERGIKLNQVDADADLAIYVAVDNTADFHPGRRASAVVFRSAAAVAEQRNLLALVRAHRATILPIDVLVRRYGESRILSDTGELGERGAILASAALRDGILAAQDGALSSPAAHIGEADDLIEALQLARAPVDLLKSLHWPGDAPPRSLRVPLDTEVIENFFEGNVPLTIEGEKQSTPYYIPSDWGKEAAGKADQYTLYGLDFVASVLNYWYLRANGVTSPKLVPLGNILKQRGVTASTLLTAAGAVILDSVENTAKLPPAAWGISYVQRRARAFELFLLCCRMAALKRIKFDELICASVFRGLVELLERLRAATFASIGSANRVGEAAVLVALSLPLRKTRYGALLLEETLEALCAYQLETGMSSDGVWHEGFAQQSSILAVLRFLVADLRAAEVSARPVNAAIARLESFLTAFLSFEGMSPPIAEMPPAKGKKPAASAPRSQSPLPGGPLREASVFPEGGFFVSNTRKKGTQPSSQLVLHARAAALGGPSLSFSVGPNSLLIGGGTHSRRAPVEARAAARENPAAHNAVRINGEDYRKTDNASEQAIRIENAWEDTDWAAVRMINHAFAKAPMARTAIHAKSMSALLVIDELLTETGAADFEIFWHLAHALRKTDDMSFRCPKGGFLNASFDAGAAVELRQGGADGLGWASTTKRDVAPNPYLVRTIRTVRAIVPSFFRWSAGPLKNEVQMGTVANGWRASVVSADQALAFAYGNGQLRLVT
jgi:hypothetical protein